MLETIRNFVTASNSKGFNVYRYILLVPIVLTALVCESATPVRPPSLSNPAFENALSQSAKPDILKLHDLQREMASTGTNAISLSDQEISELERYVGNPIEAAERLGASLVLIAGLDSRGEYRRALPICELALELMEEVRGVKWAISFAQSRASDVEREKEGRPVAPQYYALILTRYPGSAAAGYATIKSAGYLKPADAIKSLQELISTQPENAWALKARFMLGETLFNSQQQEQACIELQRICDLTDLPKEIEARTLYLMGDYRSLMGADHRQAALDSFEQVIRQFPDSRYGKRATARKASLSATEDSL